MNYKLIVAYNGKNYNGWQIQPNVNSVQAEIEKVLNNIFNENIKIIASGRTDKGVSAIGQVVNFISSKQLTEYSLKSRMNLQLPNSIKILEVEIVKENFNARFDAISKTYVYNFYISKTAIPYLDDFCYRMPYAFDYKVFEKELKSIVGEYDFSSFSASDGQVENKIRKINSIKIINNGLVYSVVFNGNGFLKNMIRIIMGTAFDIARGKIKISMKDIIAKKDRKCAGKTVGAVGLVLDSVYYN